MRIGNGELQEREFSYKSRRRARDTVRNPDMPAFSMSERLKVHEGRNHTRGDSGESNSSTSLGE
jgi:hypothetical protein